VAEGAARLWIAEYDGEVVGAQLHVRAGDRMCFYNGGTSVRWERESLGIVLLARAVEDAHELGLARVDLGAGDQQYKQRFADADEAIAWWLVRRAGAMGTLSAVRDAPAAARRRARSAARGLRHWGERCGGPRLARKVR
jgi:CelD/BcsL family acetyltransferase involved in cellulose biosynthesis